MRRLIVEEPYSAALLSQRLAMFSLAVAVIGIWELRVVLTRSPYCRGAGSLPAARFYARFWLSRSFGAAGARAPGRLAGSRSRHSAIGIPGLSRTTNPAPAAFSQTFRTDIADPPNFSLFRGRPAARGDTILRLASRSRNARQVQITAYPQDPAGSSSISTRGKRSMPPWRRWRQTAGKSSNSRREGAGSATSMPSPPV